MGAKANGRPTEPSDELELSNGKPNGHIIGRPSQSTMKKPSTIIRASSLVARSEDLNYPDTVHWLRLTTLNRLLVWYTVFVAAFQCPSSLDGLTERSSVVCKPYLTARSHVDPYLVPYYDTYAAPYVNATRPYINKLDKHIYTPMVDLGKHSYTTYGAPRINQLRGYGQAQWETSLRPQIETAQAQVQKTYDASLAPHVSKVSTATAPYYRAGRDNVLQTYKSTVLPAYMISQPYVRKSYALGHKAMVETGLPYAQWIWSSSMIFIDRTLWPKLRVLYGENVEPQLMRIGERLGRYRDGKKLMAAVKEVDR